MIFDQGTDDFDQGTDDFDQGTDNPGASVQPSWLAEDLNSSCTAVESTVCVI